MPHAPFSPPVFLRLTVPILALKRVYAIHRIDASHVFETPLPGCAGCLPFGVLRAGIGDLIAGIDRKE